MGKTFLAKSIRRFPSRLGSVWVDCSDRADITQKLHPSSNWFDLYAVPKWESNVFLDDLGADPVISEYGNRFDYVAEFIDAYYRKGSGRMIITTNLHSNRTAENPNDGLLERYGARILDRLRDMTVVVPMRGQSKRSKEIVR